MKKLMVVGREKPKHICQGHWVNLSALIADEKNVKLAKTSDSKSSSIEAVFPCWQVRGEGHCTSGK